MSEGDLFLGYTRAFEALGVLYMITGSVAATLYGEPRVTHDVDIVLDLSPGMARRSTPTRSNVVGASRSTATTCGSRRRST